MTSIRRNDVASTSFQCHVPTRFLINQYQIITFLILKSDIIENSRTELKEIVLPVPSNQISYIYYDFTLQLSTFVIFSPFHIEIEGKCGWIIVGGAGGGKGYVAPPPSQIIGGPSPPPPPLPTPLFILYLPLTYSQISK